MTLVIRCFVLMLVVNTLLGWSRTAMAEELVWDDAASIELDQWVMDARTTNPAETTSTNGKRAARQLVEQLTEQWFGQLIDRASDADESAHHERVTSKWGMSASADSVRIKYSLQF